MNIEAARALLDAARSGLDVSPAAITEALRATGDLPEQGLHDQLKRAVYDDSHAWVVDHERKREPVAQQVITLTSEQFAAVDDTAGLE